MKRPVAFALVAASLLVGSVTPTGASADAPFEFVDITSSDEGQAKATDHAVYQTVASGTPVSPEDVRVFAADQQGESIYYATTNDDLQPSGLNLTITQDENGDITVEGSMPEAGETPPFPREVTPQGWTWIGGSCFNRLETILGWLDPCYKRYRWSSTVSGKYVHLVNFYASFRTKSTHKMKEAWMQATATGGQGQSWADWDPGATSTKSCQSWTLSVNTPVGFSAPFQWCDTIAPYKSANGTNPWLQVHWYGSTWSMREIEGLMQTYRTSSSASAGYDYGFKMAPP